jgi:hypothetical protein
MSDKIRDIFKHTDSKVAEVLFKIIKCYNKKASNKIDPKTDHDFLKILDNNIALPIGYEEPMSLAEAIENDQKLK